MIHEFDNSSLTLAELCTQRSINPKCFSLRRIKLKADSKPDAFAIAVPGLKPLSGSGAQVSIQYGRVTLRLLLQNAQVIAERVKALSA
ncbi:hypothetical protein GCM10027217_14630 [Pseudomaricurvus hydrocarbonicus]